MTKFTYKQYLAENISLQRSNCNIFGLTDTVALLANEARVLRFRVFFGYVLSKTKSVTPNFFAFLTKVDDYLSAWQVKKKTLYVGTFWARTSLMVISETSRPNAEQMSCNIFIEKVESLEFFTRSQML